MTHVVPLLFLIVVLTSYAQDSLLAIKKLRTRRLLNPSQVTTSLPKIIPLEQTQLNITGRSIEIDIIIVVFGFLIIVIIIAICFRQCCRAKQKSDSTGLREEQTPKADGRTENSKIRRTDSMFRCSSLNGDKYKTERESWTDSMFRCSSLAGDDQEIKYKTEGESSSEGTIREIRLIPLARVIF